MSLLGDLRVDIGDGDSTTQAPSCVTGPGGGVTDEGVARFDGTTGTQIQGSLATLDDVGNLTTPGDVTAGTALITQGAFILTPTIITAAGPVAVSPTDSVIMINKTVPAPTTVTLPSAQTTGRFLVVKDLGGDAAANNITVLASGGETIDGLAGFIMSQNYQSITFLYNGSGWSVI